MNKRIDIDLTRPKNRVIVDGQTLRVKSASVNYNCHREPAPSDPDSRAKITEVTLVLQAEEVTFKSGFIVDSTPPNGD